MPVSAAFVRIRPSHVAPTNTPTHSPDPQPVNQVVEYAPPLELLRKPGGHFRALCEKVRASARVCSPLSGCQTQHTDTHMSICLDGWDMHADV